jgi:V/A-type H+-transporting ATPase subunit D
MARLALNKTTLSREVQQLKIFERFLPSLDLKRKQLLTERVKAAAALHRTERELAPIDSLITEQFPMASREDVDLTGLVRIQSVTLDQENVVGVKLPVLRALDIETLEYGLLGRPHWVDRLARTLHDTIALEIRLQVERRRLELLEVAVRKITQRVNLFEKVLIPRARESIRRIRIYLSDTERAGVVQAKISKKKRAVQESA